MKKDLIFINPEIGLTKEIVFNNFVRDGNKIIPARTKEEYLKKYGFYDAIVNYYPDSQSIIETLVRIVHDIDIRPVCKYCGGPVKFNRSIYFPTYCSSKCKNNDPDMIKLNAERVSESLKLVYQKNKDKINKKREKTMKKRYNDINPFKVSKHKSKNLTDTLYDLMSETGLPRTEYCCSVKCINGNFLIDIFFPERNKVIILNNSYTFLPNDIERNKIIESDLNDFEMDYIYIIKDMIYNNRDNFKEYVMNFYYGTLKIEDRRNLIIS